MKIRTIARSSILFCFLICSSFVAWGQSEPYKLISGTITHQEAPLQDVNIAVEGTNRGTKTDANGVYSIRARQGDLLVFSYVGYETVGIVIEDVTETLNLELIPERNTLDTAVVTARKKQESVSSLTVIEEKALDVDLNLAGRTFNPLKSGFATSYIPKALIDNGLPLALTLNGKVAGLQSDGSNIYIRGGLATVLVDGANTPHYALPDSSIIVDLFVIKSAGILYIRTINDADYIAEQNARNRPDHTNKNYYQDDANTKVSELMVSNEGPRLKSKPTGDMKTIRGEVTFWDVPMNDVHVFVEGSSTRITKTNKRGKYKIDARQGEVLVYSHIGYKTVTVIVEDVTSEISLDMVPVTNELDEVVVTAKTNQGKLMTFTGKAEAKYRTALGEYDPKASGFSTAYYDASERAPAATNLLELISGKFAGVQANPVTGEIRIRNGTGSILNDVPPIWEVDGMILDRIPDGLDINIIKDIRILKSLGATTRYGSVAAGGVIVISTISGDYQPKDGQNASSADAYANQNFYADDATSFEEESLSSGTAVELREQLLETTNPEELKAIAYQFQAMGLKRDAIAAYKKVCELRPNYAQSYRDLANAYLTNEQFVQAWRLYMAFLNKGFNGSNEGIEELVFDEMEWLYFRRNNQTNIKESFRPRSDDIVEFRNDVRFVFEWNTSEAEFDLEFVAPDRRAYVFEHTLSANQQLINEEKRKGYSSKRFFIDDIEDGEWLVNLSYKGNKKATPTYFKFTTYYNWGKVNERQETRVFKLNPDQRGKLQLLRVNRQVLIASN